MDRMDKFEQLKTSVWYGKLFKKLRKSDIEFCINFLESTKNLDNVAYWDKLKMLNIDTKVDMPKKQFLLCFEILDCCKE